MRWDMSGHMPAHMATHVNPGNMCQHMSHVLRYKTHVACSKICFNKASYVCPSIDEWPLRARIMEHKTMDTIITEDMDPDLLAGPALRLHSSSAKPAAARFCMCAGFCAPSPTTLGLATSLHRPPPNAPTSTGPQPLRRANT